MKPRLYFRADASPQIGAGHLRRCAVLAKACLNLGADCEFLIRSHDFDWRVCGVPADAAVVAVPWDLDSDEEANWLAEHCCRKALKVGVLDHYRITDAYQQRLHAAGLHWLLFGNPAHHHQLMGELVHDASPGVERRTYESRLVDEQTRLLLGPPYALMDASFRQVRDGLSQASGLEKKLEALLLTFGGGDDRGALMKVLRWLDQTGFDGRRVVMTSSMNPRLNELKEAAAQSPSVELVLDNWQPASLMAQCQAAICAGGTTLHELACLGVPALVLAIAENQIAPGMAWEQAGLGLYAGVLNTVDESALLPRLKRFVEDAPQRQQLSQNCWQTQDGLGAERVAQALMELAAATGS